MGIKVNDFSPRSFQMAASKKNLDIYPGFPQPLGASKRRNGINFAVFSKNASKLSLCLFHPQEKEPLYEIELNPTYNKTGDIWHVLIEKLDKSYHYGYRLDGPYAPEKGLYFDKRCVLSDPYAKALATPPKWGQKKHLYKEPFTQRSVMVLDDDEFDWEEDNHPKQKLKDLVIYEMHVRGFTQDPSSAIENKGCFAGIIEKIPYLKKMGINCIELLPIHEFNELEFPRKNPQTGETLINYWGYSTLNFFAPMNRYSSANDPLAGIHEFKTMVKELHKNKIEVILDVVFNHTAEGNEKGPLLSFRGLENNVYYMLSPHGHFMNYSGCGNTFNCNHPVARELIHDCLRYWVTEMHIDGFRFDLASILGRASDGTPMSKPPLLEQIALDPLFAKTKLIAEAWDAAGLYQVGTFPSWGIWAEWNGKYRDSVRRFIKGSSHSKAEFATRICGSQDLYGNGRTPGHSINFVTSHDGFSLKDLVSYNHKKNQANAENNCDGENDNESWNCGHEGDSKEPKVLELREKQMRNFMTALFVSQGVPMLTMGDEYGHSKEGNNNTWCQDNKLSWFSWEAQEKNKNFFQFCQRLIQFRKKTEILRHGKFLNEKDIEWHGIEKGPINWSCPKPFLAFTLKDPKMEHIYVAFNADYREQKVSIPRPPKGKKWYRIANTALKSPEDFPKTPKLFKSLKYKMQAYSSLILQAH